MLKRMRRSEIAIQDTTERVDIQVVDINGVATNATTVQLTVYPGWGQRLPIPPRSFYRDAYPFYTLRGTVTVAAGNVNVYGTNTKFDEDIESGDTVTIDGTARLVDEVHSATWFTLTVAHPGATDATATKTTRIVRPATGIYYIEWGDPAAPANIERNTETGGVSTWVFIWQVTIGYAERETAAQLLNVVSPFAMQVITQLGMLLDKTAKKVNTDPTKFCPLGYSDGELYLYLMGGLSKINTYQPYVQWTWLEQYPYAEQSEVLLEAATYVGVNAQTLYAVDNDIENWSNQGASFPINHFPKLAQYNAALLAHLDITIPKMKMHYALSGSVSTQVSVASTFMAVLRAAPEGALFRNSITRNGFF